jgi:hypothetical protein
MRTPGVMQHSAQPGCGAACGYPGTFKTRLLAGIQVPGAIFPDFPHSDPWVGIHHYVMGGRLRVHLAILIMKLIKEIQIPIQTPLKMICNNLIAIHLAQNPIHHGRVKHMAIKHHWIRKHIQAGAFTLKQVYTSNMIADILTKNLGKCPPQKFCDKI